MAQRFGISIRIYDYCHGIMTLPEHAVWYRGYDPNAPILSPNPMFFGDIEVASLYTRSSPGRRLGEFNCKKNLRVLDMRYIMSILPYMLQKDLSNEAIVEKITIALGICGFERQIGLLDQLDRTDYPQLPTHIQRMRDFAGLTDKPGWVNPIELRGVRAGITNIDYEVMVWLKDLFYPIVDGIIAPRLPTPFHDQVHPDVSRSCMMGELILFDPGSCLIHSVDRPLTSSVQYYHPTMSMQNLVDVNFASMSYHERTNIPPIRRSHYGGQNASHGTRESMLPLIRDIMGDRLATDPVFRKQFAKVQSSWQPMIKKIKKSQLFLQKVCITFCALSPE